MSQENVELMRRGFEHWIATGEFIAHRDLVWDVTELGWPDQQIYYGPDGARQFFDWAEAFDGWKVEVEEYIDAGERVVVICRQQGRSKATGIAVDMQFAQVWAFEGGRAIRMDLYATPVAALEAVNVEVVRSIYAAWLDGESARDLIDPDVEYVNPPDAVEPGTRRGRKAFAGIRSAYDDVRVEPEEFVATGDDVVVIARITGRGRGSGVDIDRRQGYIWTVHGGRGVRFRWFSTPEEALEAAGLSA